MSHLRIHEGHVADGFQYASGQAVARSDRPSPFPAGTLRMQHEPFKARGLDLEREVPGLFWGTINIRLSEELVLGKADVTLEKIAWASAIAPETFSFVRCCLFYEARYHAALIYYPHPETKPRTNAHDHHVLEVLASRVETVASGRPASIICRSDAFRRK